MEQGSRVSPRVSVILTSWNKPEFLREAIGSVLRQTYRDFELLILDDNSDAEGMAELVESYRYHPKCLVVRTNTKPENRRDQVRYAVLANLGLQLARGEYITYLCDDDYYQRDRLGKMVERLDRGDCEVVYGSQRLVDASTGGVVGYRKAEAILDDAFCKVDHSSVMHTKAVGLAVGGWDTDPQYWRFADGIFWRKLTGAGHRFYPIQEVLDVHRFNQLSVSARLDSTGQPV